MGLHLQGEHSLRRKGVSRRAPGSANWNVIGEVHRYFGVVAGGNHGPTTSLGSRAAAFAFQGLAFAWACPLGAKAVEGIQSCRLERRGNSAVRGVPGTVPKAVVRVCAGRGGVVT
jgi:hypothetical protein